MNHRYHRLKNSMVCVNCGISLLEPSTGFGCPGKPEMYIQAPPRVRNANWFTATNRVLTEAMAVDDAYLCYHKLPETAGAIEWLEDDFDLNSEFESVLKALKKECDKMNYMTMWRIEKHFRFNPSLDDVLAHIGRAILLAFWK